ncbi:MAG: hypothetical protein NVSMB6_20340 [Burkholderiaceae bacterium]
MWFEGHNCCFDAEAVSGGAHLCEQHLVAAMHAIEIANRQRA